MYPSVSKQFQFGPKKQCPPVALYPKAHTPTGRGPTRGQTHRSAPSNCLVITWGWSGGGRGEEEGERGRDERTPCSLNWTGEYIPEHRLSPSKARIAPFGIESGATDKKDDRSDRKFSKRCSAAILFSQKSHEITFFLGQVLKLKHQLKLSYTDSLSWREKNSRSLKM